MHSVIRVFQKSSSWALTKKWISGRTCYPRTCALCKHVSASVPHTLPCSWWVRGEVTQIKSRPSQPAKGAFGRQRGRMNCRSLAWPWNMYLQQMAVWVGNNVAMYLRGSISGCLISYAGSLVSPNWWQKEAYYRRLYLDIVIYKGIVDGLRMCINFTLYQSHMNFVFTFYWSRWFMAQLNLDRWEC